MKKEILTSLIIIAVISLFFAGTVTAYKAGYTLTDGLGTEPTMDGKWTTDSEWADSFKDRLYSGWTMTANVIALKHASSVPDWVRQYFLIEFLTDNTNDTGDFWQICYASAPSFFQNPPGGTTPGTTCLRIDFVGHKQAGLTIYKGNGTGWNVLTGYTWPTHIEIVDSISASPTSATPHWIVEIKIDHMYADFGTTPFFWIRLAAYDASNPSAGALTWPPMSNRDVPDDYGNMPTSQDTIPEGLTIEIIILVSTVAVIVGTRYFRKRPKWENW